MIRKNVKKEEVQKVVDKLISIGHASKIKKGNRLEPVICSEINRNKNINVIENFNPKKIASLINVALNNKEHLYLTKTKFVIDKEHPYQMDSIIVGKDEVILVEIKSNGKIDTGKWDNTLHRFNQIRNYLKNYGVNCEIKYLYVQFLSKLNSTILEKESKLKKSIDISNLYFMNGMDFCDLLSIDYNMISKEIENNYYSSEIENLINTLHKKPGLFKIFKNIFN